MSAESVERIVERLTEQGIDVVRVGYPDLIGTERGKDVLLERLPEVAESGVAFCRAVYHTSPQGDTVAVPGGLDLGLPDVCIRPDLSTLVELPWEPGVAHCLGDAYDPATGLPLPESPRSVTQAAAARLAELGLTGVVGPELEYFLLEPDGAGWKRYDDAPGNVYVTGRKGDRGSHVLRSLRTLRRLDIGVTMGNHEYSGGQFEINLNHSEATDAADRAFRFKSAVKELARHDGLMATFMAKPFNDEGGSGFHAHISCVDGDGRNVFADPAAPYGLSATALHAIGGVHAHASALAALLNPTINSYKRFGPDTLAPWLNDWGLDNRSAMLRVPPERGAGTRLEVRLGDASANPYLGIAGLLAAVYLGIRDRVEPPAPLEGYGYDTAKAAVLPMSLPVALDAFEADGELIEVLGKEFAASYLAYKRNEVERFSQSVTDWEFREYAYHL
ncbi:glutamine synthetase family protein [Streptosporangium roseum]|uniref:Glutamate--ammonia ligase n=1 Tax=Streptosporangium roseum (strain ATCC 12428 / DSM 43021 / JCM 3005 / KCTC 9067 / NCIMB 10171 / NRRL 2505 / NI 9100) TaxID=479432 RepID=D2BFL8_STRRD|nr:glutamine synthetase family protein [Streptosporangium roseum]ACZ90179.1 Glutamate--ammonia ligase [Streptosporangium roseum DSM 43021]